jgi:magnesium transporter
MGSSAFGVPIYDPPSSHRPQYQNPYHKSSENVNRRPRTAHKDSDEEEDIGNERTPLIPSSAKAKSSNATYTFGGEGASRPVEQSSAGRRRPSSKSSSKSKRNIFDKPTPSFPQRNDSYNVNYPPSVPGSPTLSASGRGDMNFGDLMARDEFSGLRDNVSESAIPDDQMSRSSTSPRREGGMERRHTIALQAEEDVCFPIEGMSEAADDDTPHRDEGAYRRGPGVRRRRSRWPDLAMLDDWSRFEKEGRSDERRAKKITEPQLIGGRLRPIHKGWHRAEDDAPYRFTYFNEEFPSTIHSQTISELVQPGGTFRELFIPDPPELEDSSDSEEEEDDGPLPRTDSQIRHVQGFDGESRAPTRQGSLFEQRGEHKRGGSVTGNESKNASGEATPNGGAKSPEPPRGEKTKRYGDRPTWWLDVLSPTDAEMKVISKTFGIHPLTAEDIMMQEAREKVELFRNYYFVNYRSFEQDMNNEDFLEPVNMYVVVFREGVISFHFSMTPHPANVRRRVRQLKDFLILSSDWISYAIIDDITDVFAPLIQNIEDEVDDIDDAILKLHAPNPEGKPSKDNEKGSEYGDGTSGESGGDMLRRVGDCRKKVMGLYRLLGNKADVIKGFAKRCNEHWEIAPRSEIGLYLGDIQDHIVTMTGNLSHYEK